MYIPNKQTFPKDPAEPETEICPLRFRVHEVDGATTSRQKKGEMHHKKPWMVAFQHNSTKIKHTSKHGLFIDRTKKTKVKRFIHQCKGFSRMES